MNYELPNNPSLEKCNMDIYNTFNGYNKAGLDKIKQKIIPQFYPEIQNYNNNLNIDSKLIEFSIHYNNILVTNLPNKFYINSNGVILGRINNKKHDLSVSKYHVSIIISDKNIYIIDIGSSNGTKVKYILNNEENIIQIGINRNLNTMNDYCMINHIKLNKQNFIHKNIEIYCGNDSIPYILQILQ